MARTSINTASETGQLTVKGVKPELVPVEEKYRMVLEGDRLSLPCKLKDGVVPAPSVIWYRNGEEVEQSRVREEEDNRLETGPLTTVDAGEYICQATNSEGKDIIKVDVWVKPRTAVWIVEGDNLSLPCDLKYTLWRHNNEEILYVIGGGKVLLFSKVDLEAAENGTHLIIQNVRPGDAGVGNDRL